MSDIDDEVFDAIESLKASLRRCEERIAKLERYCRDEGLDYDDDDDGPESLEY